MENAKKKTGSRRCCSRGSKVKARAPNHSLQGRDRALNVVGETACVPHPLQVLSGKDTRTPPADCGCPLMPPSVHSLAGSPAPYALGRWECWMLRLWGIESYCFIGFRAPELFWKRTCPSRCGMGVLAQEGASESPSSRLLIIQARQWRPREAKQLAQDHTGA